MPPQFPLPHRRRLRDLALPPREQVKAVLVDPMTVMVLEQAARCGRGVTAGNDRQHGQ